MQAVQRTTEIASTPRQYRNRPNPRKDLVAEAEPLIDVVYLVGDDPILCEQVSTNLAATETKVIAFLSATEYLDFAGKAAAACVVIDCNLPDMSGLELQCRLASTTNPPVVFVSDRSDVPFTVRAMKAGAIDFFEKPFDLAALVMAIQTGLAHDRRTRQRQAELGALQERLHLLTPREREVLPLVIGGLLNKQAAGILGISEVTLQIHRSQVMRKMQANSVAELVRMAMKLRISHWREQPNASKTHQ
jgi:FixJ family two-component response regulator